MARESPVGPMPLAFVGHSLRDFPGARFRSSPNLAALLAPASHSGATPAIAGERASMCRLVRERIFLPFVPR